MAIILTSNLKRLLCNSCKTTTPIAAACSPTSSSKYNQNSIFRPFITPHGRQNVSIKVIFGTKVEVMCVGVASYSRMLNLAPIRSRWAQKPRVSKFRQNTTISAVHVFAPPHRRQ